jgi:putative ABC transport system substrate-binding protein
MNTRRRLIIALGTGALTAPLGSFAQQPKRPKRIGFLWGRAQSTVTEYLASFGNGMRELGYVEGRDYVAEQRAAPADFARLPALAAELVALKVDLIVTTSLPTTVAARNATSEIPILGIAMGDPVAIGLAATMSRPGGNVTGLTAGVASELYTKRLDLLHQMLPAIRRVGILHNPDSAAEAAILRQLELDCAKLELKVLRAPVRKREDIASVFNALKRDQAQGLLVTATSTNVTWRESIIEYAAKNRLPAVYSVSIFAESGGLISYGANYPDLYRRAAVYVDKMFKGAKPGDLPIEQPVKFETVINLKTAKSLGIKIPDVVMLRADKVIE